MQSRRGLRWLLILMMGWGLLVFALVAWWGRVVYRQGEQIVHLEQQMGLSPEMAQQHWEKTQRMLFWESSTFFVLLVTLTGLLAWLYYRELQRSRSVQAFFASFTHELKTPLTSIRLQAESIAEQSKEQNLVNRLLEDTQRLEAQVERTLELARIEGGGSLFSQSLSLKRWLERVLPSLLRFQEGKIVFDEPRVDSDLSVKADPFALQMVFRNLLENSVRHSRALPAKISLTADDQGKTVKVRYHDHASSFSGETRNLGKLFYRGQGSQGAGVGLYLIRMLMERMGGRADFSSSNQSGFIVDMIFAKGDETDGRS
jgi:signal transduction histidine kinase